MNREDVRRLKKMIESANAEALSAGLEKAFAEGCDENGFWSPRIRSLAFVSEAKQELLRLIVDVQKNRNRPE